MNIFMAIDEHLYFHGFLAFLCIMNQIFEEEHFFFFFFFLFNALYRINYVKSVSFTNLFLLQYRAPPELTEF